MRCCSPAVQAASLHSSSAGCARRCPPGLAVRGLRTTSPVILDFCNLGEGLQPRGRMHACPNWPSQSRPLQDYKKAAMCGTGTQSHKLIGVRLPVAGQARSRVAASWQTHAAAAAFKGFAASSGQAESPCAAGYVKTACQKTCGACEG